MKKQKKQITEKTINTKFNILAIICICIFSLGLVTKTLQNDTFYTITLGKYVLEHGIDMMEHFAWHEGLIYTYPHWLYDIFIYSIYHSFGFMGVYVSSIAFGAILGFSIYFVTSKLSKNNLISFFITLLIMYLGRVYITARAQLVTFILFVWTIFFIEKFLKNKKIRYVIPLVLIPIAISNIHAAVFPFYFILFLPYIGEYIISLIMENTDFIQRICLKSDKREIKKISKKEVLTQKQKEKLERYSQRVEKNEERFKQREEIRKSKKGNEYKIVIEKNKNVKWLILVMVICVFTGLITPIGDTPYTYLLHTMKGNTTGNIAEHLPLTLYNNKEALVTFSVAIALLAFTKIKIKLKDLFFIAGLMLLTLMSRRQLSMFLFIGGISLNNLICDFINKYGEKRDIKETKKYITTAIGQIITYILIILVTICMYIKIKDTQIVDTKSYPQKACDYILNNLDVKQIKLFNDYNYGSYLMYRGIPVFIDSRADVYDPQFSGFDDDIFQDYIQTYTMKVYYEDKFEHYGITHVITYKKSQLALFIEKTSNYKELYKDDDFVVYERVKDNKHEKVQD